AGTSPCHAGRGRPRGRLAAPVRGRRRRGAGSAHVRPVVHACRHRQLREHDRHPRARRRRFDGNAERRRRRPAATPLPAAGPGRAHEHRGAGRARQRVCEELSLPFADLVATSVAVAGTRARSSKVSSLAGLLRRVPPAEIGVVVGFLVGAPRQGRVGVGWALLGPTTELQPAAGTSLTVADVDVAIDNLQGTTGAGSTAARKKIVNELFARATTEEADFLRRLLIGDMRPAALEGVMTDAIAKAAAVPVAVVRRAAMLAGDLCRVAADALQGGEHALTAIGLEVLRPVLPMLAATAPTVAEALEAN